MVLQHGIQRSQQLEVWYRLQRPPWIVYISVYCAPVAVVTRHEPSCDEQYKIHKPPDAQTSQSEELAHSGARVSQAEAIYSKASQEEGVQQRGNKIVACVPAQRQIEGLRTMNSWTHSTASCQFEIRENKADIKKKKKKKKDMN